MSRTTKITVSFSFEGVHLFENAAGKYAFLAYPHRHLFIGKFTTTVEHNDREIEFLEFREALLNFVHSWGIDLGRRSCEDMCHEILDWFQTTYDRWAEVSIFEDGENGATVTLEPVNEEA
jgi:hypothetical protein